MDKGIEALKPVCVPKRIVRNWAAAVMRTCDFCGHHHGTVLNDDGSAICATCCDAEHSGNLQCALEDAIQRNAELIAALEAENALNKHLDLAIRKAEGCSEALRRRAEAAENRRDELESAPNGMMQLSNELTEMKRKCIELQEQKDKWAAWAIALGAKADELESRPLCVKSNDAMREVVPLCVKLPDSSSKAFWSGIGKTEQFHPETYKHWVKEAIERAGDIAGIKVEVK